MPKCCPAALRLLQRNAADERETPAAAERQMAGPSKRPYKKLKSVRAGIIGYGGAFGMGLRHGQSMEATGRMKVVAICDLDKDRRKVAEADWPKATTYAKVDKLLAEAELDLAVIILPHNLHAPVALQCLEAGCHVVTEKPMCLTVAEATAMIDAAREHRRMVSVFHNRRWDGDFMTLRELVCERKLIGDVFHVEMYGGGYGKPGTWWRSFKEVSGGLFYDWGAHYLDWLLQLMPGRVTGVTGFFHKLKWFEVSNEDNVEAAIRFDDGAVAHVHWSSLAMAGKERWRILGTEGAIVSADGRFVVKTLHGDLPATIEVRYRDSDWDAYYRNIAEHLTGDAELIVTAEQARRVIGIMEYAERSSASGVTEALPYE